MKPSRVREIATEAELGIFQQTRIMVRRNIIEQAIRKALAEDLGAPPSAEMESEGGMLYPGSDPSYCNAGAREIFTAMAKVRLDELTGGEG